MTQELMEDIVIPPADLFKRLVVVEVISDTSKYHRNQTFTIELSNITYSGALLKSKYKLKSGVTRLKFVIDGRNIFNRDGNILQNAIEDLLKNGEGSEFPIGILDPLSFAPKLKQW